MPGDVEVIKPQIAIVQAEKIEDVAADLGRGQEQPGQGERGRHVRILRQEAGLQSRCGPEILLDPVERGMELAVGFFELAVARGELAFEAQDALGGTQPDAQLLEVERLGQEVIGTRGHALDQVVLVVARGQEDEVGVMVPLHGADPSAELQPVDLGHHPVADDQTDRLALEDLPGLAAVAGRYDLMPPTLEQAPEDLPRVACIVGNQDTHGG